MVNKPFPKSYDAEESLLGAILLEGKSIYEKVSPWIRVDEAFHSNDNKMIWNIIKTLYKENTPIDVVTVMEKSKSMYNGDDTLTGYYLTGLPEKVPTTANVEEYARIIWEKYIQRETAKSANRLYNVSFDETENVQTILDEHSRLIEELKEIQPSRVKTIEDIVDEAKVNIKEGGNLIPFGMDVLDYPAGGMTRKEITVLGGRPGHGKTTLMINILKSLIEQGLKVMLFNREMSNTEMIKKMCVLENKELLYADVRKNQFNDDTKIIMEMQMEKIKIKYKKLKMYDHIRSLSDTMSEIAKHKPDIIIDDYIQLIQADGVNEGRRFEIEKIMQEYKWICKSENASAFLLSQLNREMDRRINPEPKMSDYSESGVIEQTAETAMFVFYGYNFDSESYDKYESKIISAKARYGNVGSYMVGFNGNKCKFYGTRQLAFDDTRNKSNTKT
jgi:replicative DNA helicase|tara:strand:- start:10221 stop:11555 length:1335 start_codon:yes stop_codon:yes gene_type:complete